MQRIGLLATLGAAIACGGNGTSTVPDDVGGDAPAMQLVSSAFAAGAELPAVYTCEGENVSPPLSWSGAPASTRSYALVVHDPDVPDPAKPERIWVHWVVLDLPAATTELAQGAATALPTGARGGTNDFGNTVWGGACPPVGRHRYFFSIYALDTLLAKPVAPTRDELLRAIDGHVVAKGELIGTYQKKG
jgi:Raf kinase inhibitor-like YbhB/YbcL family protein